MNYTFDGNPRIEAVIRQHQDLIVKRVCSVIPTKCLAAIVLIGGYGRSEGGYILEGDHYKPYNDYDYFLVFRNISRRQAVKLVRSIPCLEQEIGIEVDFFPLLEEKLGELEFSLMNAEMLAGSRVIHGDANIFQKMAVMPLSRLLMSEFLRMLTNRGCLLLMNHRDSEHDQYSKFINKAWLAIGDSLFATAERYELLYLNKQRHISEVTNDSRIIECFERAVNIRLRPDLHPPWQLIDLEEVTNYWIDVFVALKQRQARRGIDPTLLSLLENFLRNVKDRRLRSWDRHMFCHPRLRVTGGLLSILRDTDDSHMRDNADSLLGLWSSYS